MDKPVKMSEEQKAKSKAEVTKIGGQSGTGAIPKKPFAETGAIPKKPFAETGAIPKKRFADTGAIPKNPSGESSSVPMKPSSESGTSPRKTSGESSSVPMEPSSESGTSPRKTSDESCSVPIKPSSESGTIPRKQFAETFKASKDVKVKSNTLPRRTPSSILGRKATFVDMTVPVDMSMLFGSTERNALDMDFVHKCLKSLLTPQPSGETSRPQSPYDDSDDESFGASDEELQNLEIPTNAPHSRHVYYDQEDTQELRNLQEEIQTNGQLIEEIQAALDVFSEIKNGGLEAAEERAEDDLIYAARSLIIYVQEHVQRVAIHAERLSIDVGREAYLNKHPLPWFGIVTFRSLFHHLAAKHGISVSPSEVKDTININFVLTKYNEYQKYSCVHSSRFPGIMNDIIKYNELSEKILRIREEFVKTIRIGNFPAAKTLEQKRYLISWLREMARACDDHLTLSSFALLLVKEKLYEFVTENGFFMKELRNFFRRRHFLFQKVYRVKI